MHAQVYLHLYLYIYVCVFAANILAIAICRILEAAATLKGLPIGFALEHS